MKRIAIWRRCVQILFIALFCALPWLNGLGYNEVNGSLFAFDLFGVPFADPASAAQAGAGALTGKVPVPFQILWGALIALIIALILGRVFCGWICPYGLFSDVLCSLRKKLNFIKPLSIKNDFRVKILLVISGLLVIFFLGYPLITLLSFPGELSLIPLLVWQNNSLIVILLAALPPLAALAVEALCGVRLWCRFVCPQSLFLGLAAMPRNFPGLKIAWNASKCSCGKNSPCRESCQLGLNPRAGTGPSRRDCTVCGDCLSTCAKKGGALNFKIGKD